MSIWTTARFDVDLSRPRVMGIVNVTPDSFSDGGRYRDASAAMAHCDALVAEGADLLDIGGESTRPGAAAPDVDEELVRVLPVVRHAVTLGVPVSVDTSAPEVMRAVLDAGADVVNDVRALTRPGALDAVAAHPRAGVCLMHMRGEPGSMQRQTTYDDVVAEVAAFLGKRAGEVRARGVDAGRIVVDPGVGFAKTVEHNLELLRRQHELLTIVGYPLLVGWSRKSTLGALTGRPVGDRLAASVAAAVLAVDRGAAIVRVHDVAPTVDALTVWRAATVAGASLPADAGTIG
ncbi:MAG: dihydropteroate synthase [Burkholderiaceae bacterium]|jgi:dihydropteroate synthase|nr:dihydropteroate synthase [Burkholderiaceae bacterium]